MAGCTNVVTAHVDAFGLISFILSVFLPYLIILVTRFNCTVDEGAIIDVQFSEFYHVPPSGFDKIMFEQSLL